MGHVEGNDWAGYGFWREYAAGTREGGMWGLRVGGLGGGNSFDGYCCPARSGTRGAERLEGRRRASSILGSCPIPSPVPREERAWDGIQRSGGDGPREELARPWMANHREQL
ncbi:hypothetical protein NL676_016637 [Syzygium grande]|nr:hypothetical protein NL676_016637 [Syzygium grande]